MKHTYVNPDHVGTYARSVTHNWFGALAVKSRLPRSGDRAAQGSGRVVRTNKPNPWRASMRSDNARILQQAMIQATTTTGKRAAVDGLRVGIKTGTAQLGTDPPKTHAWIVGFAGPPNGPSELVVSVLVEGQEGSVDQTGGAVAGPIAKALFAQYLNR